jgi:hypothetical protein
MIGADHIENLFRASLGFAGNGVPQRAAAGAVIGAAGAYAADPNDPNLGREVAGALLGAGVAATGIPGIVSGDKLGFAIANLPNALINLRNEFRFDLDPMFQFRRLAKSNVKMAAEGVPMTLNPLKAMQAAGTDAEDRATLERVTGVPQLASNMAEADSAEMYAKSQGVYGLFNPRNMEAYYAGHLAWAGATDDEIKAGLIRTFEYGAGTVAGRSPLERSVNMMFFPFSFDKTLYRNLGGYLLDRPGQRMILTRGMAAYDQFNKNNMDGNNPLATAFYTKHLPLLTEVTQLNAFAHGVSLGEPGGINRPLLNLFLPQAWSSSKDNVAMLKRYLPVVSEFSRIYNETSDQASIVSGMAQNMWHDLEGIPVLGPVFGKNAGYTFSSPPKSTLTTQAQLDAGFAMQHRFFTNYATVLDYNAQSSNTQKINFPTDRVWGDYAGQPITKATIRSIIHGYYPKFDPNGAVISALNKTTAWNDYTRHLQATNPTAYQDVTAFQDNVKNLGKVMASNSSPASDVAALTTLLRQKAASLAEQDSTFFGLYAKTFGKLLGPLERIQ